MNASTWIYKYWQCGNCGRQQLASDESCNNCGLGKRPNPFTTCEHLPLQLVIQVDATNGTTTMMGVEEIVKLLREFKFPAQDLLIERPFFKVQVLKAKNTL